MLYNKNRDTPPGGMSRQEPTHVAGLRAFERSGAGKGRITMKKIIRKKLYDTDTAQLVASRAFSYYGDPAGYEEKLYQTPEGLYFLYGIGGETSPYPDPAIKAVSKANAQKWQEEQA